MEQLRIAILDSGNTISIRNQKSSRLVTPAGIIKREGARREEWMNTKTQSHEEMHAENTARLTRQEVNVPAYDLALIPFPSSFSLPSVN